MQTTKPVKKPTKQRKMLFKAPDHIRYKHFAAILSPELRASRGMRTLPVRSGDSVRIMRGDHKGFEGKITRVDRRKYRIYVEGLTREKVDGSAIFVPIHPSKVMITNLNLEDKWRKQVLKRKRKARETMERVEEKRPSEKVAEAKEVAEEKVLKKKPRKRRKVARKPAEKKAEEKPEEPKKPEKLEKVKRTRKKKAKEAKKEEKPETKTRAKRETTKKTKGEG